MRAHFWPPPSPWQDKFQVPAPPAPKKYSRLAPHAAKAYVHPAALPSKKPSKKPSYEHPAAGTALPSKRPSYKPSPLASSRTEYPLEFQTKKQPTEFRLDEETKEQATEYPLDDQTKDQPPEYPPCAHNLPLDDQTTEPALGKRWRSAASKRSSKRSKKLKGLKPSGLQRLNKKISRELSECQTNPTDCGEENLRLHSDIWKKYRVLNYLTKKQWTYDAERIERETIAPVDLIKCMNPQVLAVYKDKTNPWKGCMKKGPGHE